MRRIVAICLLMIYSVCNTGATVYLHHCGKNTIVSVLDEKKGSHSNCPMCVDLHLEEADEGEVRDHHDQCRDAHLNLDLKSESEQPQPNWLFGKFADFSPAIIVLPWLLTHFEIQAMTTGVSAPPFAQPLAIPDLQSTYLFNCTFRI